MTNSKNKLLQKQHEKYLKKMGISTIVKKRKRSTYRTNTNYAETYYENKINGGIEYNPVKKPPYINTDNEKPETVNQLRKLQTMGSVMIDANTGPRDLDYPVKEIPFKLKL